MKKDTLNTTSFKDTSDTKNISFKETLFKDSFLHETTPENIVLKPNDSIDKFIIRKNKDDNTIFYNSKDTIGKILTIRSKYGITIHFMSLDDSFKNKLTELCQVVSDLVRNSERFIFFSGNFSMKNNDFWQNMITKMKEKNGMYLVLFHPWKKTGKSQGLVILATEKYFSCVKEALTMSFGSHICGIKLNNGEAFWTTQISVNKDSDVPEQKVVTKLRKLFEGKKHSVCVVGDFCDA